MNFSGKKKTFAYLSIFLLFMLAAPTAQAGLDDAILLIFSWVVSVFIAAVGSISNLVIAGVISVAQYSDIVNNPSIVSAWKIVRDICNMGFILILLVISFATILRIESYNMKQWLPKLILMAILINFSRTICGLLIDASQIVTLTFVNAFSGGGGSFIEFLNIKEMVTETRPSWGDIFSSNRDVIDNFSVAVSYLISATFLIIAVIALISVLVVFVMRLIMFWILTAISPLAFLMMSFPGGRKYSSQFWGMFIQYLINGPVLAFFIWLAMITMQSTTMAVIQFDAQGIGLSNSEIFSKFVLSVGFLVGGLMMSSQIGGMGASWGMSKVNEYKGKAINMGNKGIDRGKQAVVSTAKTGGRISLGVAQGLDKNLGRAFKMEGGFVGTGAQKVKRAATFDWVKDRNRNKVESDKALYDYHQAEKAAGNDTKKLSDLRMVLNGEKYSKDKNGKFYKVNDDGLALDANNKVTNDEKNRVMASRTGVGKRDVQLNGMDAFSAKMFEGRASAHSKSWAAAKSAVDQKISEEQKDINASGMTAEMKLQQLKDGSISGARKQAIALDLASSGGFKGKSRDDVKMAKGALGSNQLLLKKFNDEIDKKFAHLNYDLSTDAGKDAFKKRYAAGKMDEVMHESAYEDANFLKALHDYKGDREFGEYTKKVSKASKIHEENVLKGLEKNFSDAGKLINADGVFDPMRKAVAEISGDLGRVFKGIDSKGEFKKGLDNLFQGMSHKQVANLDIDSFDANKMQKHFGDEKTAKTFVSQLQVSVQNNVSKKDVESIKRAGASAGLANEIEAHTKKPETKEEA